MKNLIVGVVALFCVSAFAADQPAARRTEAKQTVIACNKNVRASGKKMTEAEYKAAMYSCIKNHKAN